MRSAGGTAGRLGNAIVPSRDRRTPPGLNPGCAPILLPRPGRRQGPDYLV